MAEAAASALRTPQASPGATGDPAALGSILYVGGTLPSLSETFVYRELFALRDVGAKVEAATVHAPGRRLGDSRLDQLAAEAIPIYARGPARLLAHAFAEALSHPLKCAQTLALAARDASLGSDLSFAKRAKVLWQCLAALALARRARPRRISHIHAHMAHVPATIAMYAACQLGVGFSFTGHANDLFPNRALLKEKLRRARFTACISHWHREFYQSIAPLPAARLPIIRCGVSTPPPARPANRQFTILGVGRLVPKKGFDILVEAVADLVRDHPERPLSCRIVGEGPQRAQLQELIRARNLDRVVDLAGPMLNADVLKEMSRADLFVLPCRVDAAGDRDGIPVVLMEAMARGVCVVSGDLPTIRELVRHGETGLLTPPGDARALAAAIGALSADPALRSTLASAGRDWVATEFSTNVNTERLLAAFSGAVKDARACAV